MTDEPDEPPQLAAARSAYAAQRVPAPDGLVDTAMDTVRTELRPARRLALPSDVEQGVEQGSVTDTAFVTDTAVANAIRLTLDGDPAIVARRCRVEEEPGGEQQWRVTLSVAISYAHFERHGDDLVRTRVIEAVEALFGAAVLAVDIHVVDVFAESLHEVFPGA